MGWGMGMPLVGPAPMYYNTGPSLFSIIFFVMLAGFAVLAVQSFLNPGSEGVVIGEDRVSIVKVQVGLLGLARELQKDLDKLADRTDTDTPEGLHYVLQETVLALLRNPDYCVYATSSARTADLERAESAFNEASMEERMKFQEETLSNVNARKKTSERTGPASDMRNEYIVVTILVAADGSIKLPQISSLDDLKTALKRLGGVRAEGVQAVEVLWTPQEDGDTLTQDDITRDYPTLKTL